MKQILAATLVACLLAGCGQSAPKTPEGFVAIPNSDGRWLFINYWAIWCKPCREEIPELNHFAAEFSDQVVVYGVNFDNPAPAEHLAQAADLGIEFPLLANDPAGALSYARPTVLPTTMVINPQGEVWARLLGPQTLEKLRAAMQEPQQKLAPPNRQ